MNIKPTGLVTFLFTDIEGSTKLAQDFPDTLQSALDKHHSIMQNAIDSNNGFVFEIVGDAFCCAFEKAHDAVKAAVEAQLNLSKEKCLPAGQAGKDALIKVRIGIHSGKAEWSNGKYMGYITLARTARVMSSAYGEQIIVSNDSYEFVKDKFDAFDKNNISFRDLGDRRLKDLIQPVRLFQVTADDLRSEFPPLKTLDARPNNLPVQLTSFIGREKEITDIKDSFSNGRLLTLIGPGGTGKTRLSMQLGADMIDEFVNGVWLVELASLNDPFLLPNVIVETLDLKEEPGKSPEISLLEFLKEKEILLILDNCEHLVDSCSLLTEKLLKYSSRLKIIATSREALRCEGEITHMVFSLSHPEPNENITAVQLSQYEAVRLFIERALAVNSGFRVSNENAPALAQICFQLDGIPLAIELAAVRINVLTVEKISEKLDDRFRLLTGGKRTALPRQQTLRALIDWSYDLLSDSEKVFWRRLSVFSGSWTLNDAEEICSDELLDKDYILELTNGLAEKSIILYIENSGRFKMLETIKQYGQEKLFESGEPDKFFTRHLEHYLKLCEGAVPELTGANAKYWLDRFEVEYSNIQFALKWSIENDQKEKGNRLAGSLAKLWDMRGYFSEARNWLEKLLMDPDNISPGIRANSLRLSGMFATQQGENVIAKNYVEESLRIYRELKDKTGIANCLNILGLIDFDTGNYESSKKKLTESLEIRKEAGRNIALSSAMNSIGLLALAQGDYADAESYFSQSLEIAKELKDGMYIAIGLNNLAEIYAVSGEYEKAKTYFEEGLQVDIEIGNKNGICVSLANIGTLALQNKDFETALERFNQGLEISRETGNKMGVLYALSGLGQVYVEKGDFEKARMYFESCLGEEGDQPEIQTSALCFLGLADIYVKEDNLLTSAKFAGVVQAKYETSGAFMDDDLKHKIKNIMENASGKLGKEKATEEFEKGKAVSFEDAISGLMKS